MLILGISAFYHDSAAALIKDGEIIAAAQEERFTRKKHDPDFPRNAIEYCLEEGNITLSELDAVVFYDKPLLKFERLVETYVAFAPRGFKSFRMAIPVWLREKLFLKRTLLAGLNSLDRQEEYRGKLLFSEHHLSHAASAFFPSPFEDAVVLTLDGVGEWATTSLAIGSGSDLKMLREIRFPHSLGLLYSAFTYFCGFKVNSGEYKLMGLAPYGEPKFVSLIRDHLIDIKDDGSFRLDLDYFDYCTGLKMTNERFSSIFNGGPRAAEARLTQREMDLAASIQAVTEEVILKLTRSAARETGAKNLCLAGGVALNCVANGKILKDGKFENIWVQPAAGDAGGALGAAFAASHLTLGCKRQQRNNRADTMKGAFLGPRFDESECQRRLAATGANFRQVSTDEVLTLAGRALSDGKALGWFQGRMEFGPRSLGGRSILGDPRSPSMQSVLNLKVKYRESFRPFAPSVLREDVSEWFDIDADSPYMLIVAGVRSEHRIEMTADQKALFGIDKLNVPRSAIPAVTHVDYSARVQTVHKSTNPRYYALLERFKELTGCPVLVNTSFNVRGEPIVNTPEDAFRCFMGTELDMLVVENCVLLKEDQDPNLKRNYEEAFELD